MKLQMLAVGLSFSLFSGVFAQDTSQQIGKDEKIFKKVLNQQFSNLITGQTKNSIGNFATLDIKEPEVSFAGSSISEKSGSVLTIKASGGISDGLFQLFNNSSLNTKVSIDFQYSFLGLEQKTIVYYNDSYEAYINKRKEITDKFAIQLIAARKEQGKTLLLLKQKALRSKISDLNTAITDQKDKLIKDSLSYEAEVTTSKLDSVDQAIKAYDPSTTVTQKVTTARNIELSDLKTDIKVYGFKFGWWSIGYKVQNNAFRLFDPQLMVAEQVKKQSFASQEIRLQYSKYNWSSAQFESYFWLIGTGFSYNNNLSELEKTELTDVKNYGTNPNDRTTTDKYSVYVGNYKKNLKGLRLYGDYYKFLLKNNTLALHASPEIKLLDSYKPRYNFGVGTLFSFKDQKDETAVINAEIYYNFIDLFNSTDADEAFFERNDVGLRFSFPIKFKSN